MASTTILGDNERFLRWLLNDKKTWETSDSAMNAFSKDDEWLLQLNEIETWRTDPHSILWLHGTAGSERKALCGKVIEQIKPEKSASNGLAYFTFSTDRERPENSVICLRSLISQLCEDSSNRPFAIQDMNLLHGNSARGSAEKGLLLEALELLVARQRRTFIIIDAIQEASDSKELVELLSSLAKRRHHGLHLLLSTRPELDIQKALDPLSISTICIGFRYSIEYILLCIKEYFEYSPKWRRLHDADKGDIEGWLLEEAHGNLLWVTLCFKLLEDCPDLKDGQTFIQNLPKTILGVYDRLLSSIPVAQKLQARQLLQWMAVSERPLYLEEVAEAIMLELPASEYSGLPLAGSFEIAKICAGLVRHVFDRERPSLRKQVTFMHHTLKDYLLSGNIGSPEAAFFAISELEAQKHISHISLGYLLSAIEDAPLSKRERANFPLLGYVLENWYKHMAAIQKFVPVPDPTLDRAVKLLDARYAQRGHNELDRSGSTGLEGPEALYLDSSNFPPPLYYASLLGLVDVVLKLLLRGDQHHDSGDYFGTPLQAAAYGGHWPVIKELVDKGVDVNAISGFYGSALQAASYSGQYDAASQLLASGADVNCLSGHYGTPLQAAAFGGHAKLILLFYRCGGKDNIRGGFYGCALVAAVQGGHEEVMMLLLKNATNVNAEGNKNIPNALYGASAKGHRSMVAKLLNYEADPNKCDEFGRSALEAAIQGGHPDVVQLLLDNRATLNRVSSTGLSLGIAALQMAAQGGHRDLVQRLLRWRVVDVNYQDKDGVSPFLMAVVRGYDTIVHLLLEKGVDTSLKDKDGLTALMLAVKGGFQSLVVLLLEHEADVGAKNKAGQTPLMLAVECGHEAITFLLLQHGATTDAPDRSGRTPLDVATSKGYQVIEKLLGFGVPGTAIADRDRFWRSFSRIQTLPNEQKDCQELEATSNRDDGKYIPQWVGEFPT